MIKTFAKNKTAAPLAGKGTLKQRLKSWIRRAPFFWETDYLRRKIRDSRGFDFAVRDLANSLELWPQALLLDVTNRCNAKCVWCPNPDLTDLGAMSMDLYKKIIDDYARHGGVVHFGTFGEPLMDKTFAEKLRYLKQYRSIHRVQVLTNAFFMNQRLIPVLLDHGVAVDISLDELDKATFEEVKKMSYDVVRKNILDLLEANDLRDDPVPVHFRIKTLRSMEETLEHELFQAIEAHRCTIQLTPITDNIISNWAGRFDNQEFFQSYGIETGGSRFNHKRFNLTNTAPCTQLWKWMVVYWDGSVVMCCADMFATSSLGNLTEDSIAEVWRGTQMTALRQQMVARKRFEIPLCENCDIHLSWHHLKDHYGPEGRPHAGKFL